ncbi:MAG: glycoside hydrolase family 3 N-terminal domain-containing protein [Acidimicrobiales bacterium]
MSDERPGPDAPYRDPNRPTDERVGDLLGRMTLTEKVAQLVSAWLTLDEESGEFAPSQFSFGSEAIGDLGEAMAHGMGQITRPLGSQPIDPVDGVRIVNEIQRRLVEETRLGIPAICHEECLTGAMFLGATSFPSPLNFASTWDPELVGRVGDTIRRQMRSVGAHQGLAPVADVARDPRWGRVEETLGEDPYLVGRLVTAYVRGLQGGDPAMGSLAHGVIATLKHFVGYSGSEGGRNFAPTHVGPRELADLYLVPFEMAVKEGGARSVMNSYQEVDGEAPAGSRRLLTEVLREQWGFDGFVVADYGAVSFLHLFHHVTAGRTESAAAALSAGLDVELPNPGEYPAGIPDAIDQGLLALDDVDRAVERVLRHKVELGLFESPYVDADHIDLDRPEDRDLAAEVARRSITVLANDGVLPIDPTTTAHIAVLGPNADDLRALFGNYSFENHILFTHFPHLADRVQVPTVLDALRERLTAADVATVAGCAVMGTDESGLADAVAAAGAADLAIVVVGDKAGHFRIGTVGEGTDTADLALPGLQARLVDEVLATGTPTIVVLLNGRPFALGDVAGRASAIVEAWFPGQDGAAAVADVLVGATEPAGRTPVTFSRGAGVQPWAYNHKALAPGFPKLPETEPVFPFGHGLSYTTFAYDDLELAPDEVPTDGTITASCTVTNTGDRPGDEVVQLYLHDPVASTTRPVLELKGFARVPLDPGRSARVTFAVPVELAAFSGIDLARIVEPGRLEVAIGASSADLRLRGAVEVVGEVRLVGEDRALTSSSSVVPA